MRTLWVLGAFAVLAGCAEVTPLFAQLVDTALAGPNGIMASRSSNPAVHCQTDATGRTDCYEYRLGGPVPPRDAGISGATTRRERDEVSMPVEHRPAPYPNAPVAPAPEPLPRLE